jgi:hypothetical protein
MFLELMGQANEHVVEFTVRSWLNFVESAWIINWRTSNLVMFYSSRSPVQKDLERPLAVVQPDSQAIFLIDFFMSQGNTLSLNMGTAPMHGICFTGVKFENIRLSGKLGSKLVHTAIILVQTRTYCHELLSKLIVFHASWM